MSEEAQTLEADENFAELFENSGAPLDRKNGRREVAAERRVAALEAKLARRPALYLRLPEYSASRPTPLPSGQHFPLPGP